MHYGRSPAQNATAQFVTQPSVESPSDSSWSLGRPRRRPFRLPLRSLLGATAVHSFRGNTRGATSNDSHPTVTSIWVSGLPVPMGGHSVHWEREFPAWRGGSG